MKTRREAGLLKAPKEPELELFRCENPDHGVCPNCKTNKFCCSDLRWLDKYLCFKCGERTEHVSDWNIGTGDNKPDDHRLHELWEQNNKRPE